MTEVIENQKNDFNGTLGEFIKLKRKQKRISSSALSEELGRGSAYISQLENGRIGNPKVSTLYQIFNKLEIHNEEAEEWINFFQKNSIVNFAIDISAVKTKYIKQSTLDEIMNQIDEDANSIAKELSELNIQTKKLLIDLLLKQVENKKQ